MVEIAPAPVIVILVEFITEKEIASTFPENTAGLQKLESHACVHHSSFFLAFCFSVPAKTGFESTLSVRGCVPSYVYFFSRRLSLRARSGMAGLVFAFQCMTHGLESSRDTVWFF